MTIKSIPCSLQNSQFRTLTDDVMGYTLEYLTIRELAKAVPTCGYFNDHMTLAISQRGFNEIITFCNSLNVRIQLQKINKLFEKLSFELNSSCPLANRTALKALQDESFSCEVRVIRVLRGLTLEALNTFQDLSVEFRPALPAFWPSVFPISKAFVKMSEQILNPQKVMRSRQVYQETALLSLAGRESMGFVRAWNREGGNLLLGKVSDEFIEKVAKKAISNGKYEVARNLTKITKGYVSKLFILQLADKREKNPTITNASEKAPSIRSRYDYYSNRRLPDEKSIPKPISERAESLERALDTLWKQLVHKEKREVEMQYQKSQVARAAEESPLQKNEIKKPWQKLRRAQR